MLDDKKKVRVTVGRDFRVTAGRDEGERKEPNAMFLPEKPAKEFRSDAERKVTELLESKHPVSPAKWVRLELEERSALRQIAMDKKHPFRTKAITALVLSNDENHVDMLREIMSNNNEDKLVRAVSAISLGMSKMSSEAGHALAQFINEEDVFVRAKVVEALGKVGGKEELRALAQVAEEDGSQLVRSNAKHAINLMDYRLGDLVKESKGRKRTQQSNG